MLRGIFLHGVRMSAKSNQIENPKHPLGSWLDEANLTVAAFVRLLKTSAGVHVTRYTVDLWLMGETTPNLRNAYAIERATEGGVTMYHLVEYVWPGGTA